MKITKWKYTRIKEAQCSKWVLGNSWVTKYDDKRFCAIGINGSRNRELAVENPAEAREIVESILKQTNQSNQMKITIDNIKSYYEYRGMKWPDLKEAIDFAITELAGEALDAYIRTHQTGWTRNNPDKDLNLGHELADVYQMISIAAHEATGKTLDGLLLEKWQSKGYQCQPDPEP